MICNQSYDVKSQYKYMEYIAVNVPACVIQELFLVILVYSCQFVVIACSLSHGIAEYFGI